ncbi:MAG TPA: hypothetical protein VLJ44_04415 [Gaiellaceae bacterium]|nr:hypothetical protein [Gaiellaceae bacterium]
MIRALAGLAFANAAFLVAGAGLVRLFGWRVRSHPGLAYMSGVASVGVISTLMLIAGLALRGWQVLVLCALVASLGFVPRGRPAESTGAKMDRRIALPAGGLLGGYLVVLFVQSVFQPLNSWDAWAKWTMKARAIVLLGGLDTSVFANHAYQPLVLDYPMLIPALEAMDFRFMGRLDNLVIHVQFWLLLVGFIVAAYELLRDRVPQMLLWPSLLLVGTAPALATNLTSAYGDAPVAFFFGLAAIAGWRWLATGERRALWFLGLIGGAAVATKPEGSPFVLGLFLLLAIFMLVRRKSLLPLLAPAVWCLIAIVPWRLWISHHGIRSSTPIGKGLDPSYLVDRFDRVWPSIRSLVDKSFDGDWLAILPLALAVGVVVLGWRRSRSAPLFAGGVLAVVFLSLLWAYWVQRPGLHYLLSTSGSRTVTTLVVVGGLFLPVLGGELLRSYTGRDERRDQGGPPPARVRAGAGP